MGDLLSAAIAEVERALPFVQGQFIDRHLDTGEEIFDDIGPRSRYEDSATRQYNEIEKEMGNENPAKLSFN